MANHPQLPEGQYIFRIFRPIRWECRHRGVDTMHLCPSPPHIFDTSLERQFHLHFPFLHFSVTRFAFDSYDCYRRENSKRCNYWFFVLFWTFYASNRIDFCCCSLIWIFFSSIPFRTNVKRRVTSVKMWKMVGRSHAHYGCVQCEFAKFKYLNYYGRCKSKTFLSIFWKYFIGFELVDSGDGDFIPSDIHLNCTLDTLCRISPYSCYFFLSSVKWLHVSVCETRTSLSKTKSRKRATFRKI